MKIKLKKLIFENEIDYRVEIIVKTIRKNGFNISTHLENFQTRLEAQEYINYIKN